MRLFTDSKTLIDSKLLPLAEVASSPLWLVAHTRTILQLQSSRLVVVPRNNMIAAVVVSLKVVHKKLLVVRMMMMMHHSKIVVVVPMALQRMAVRWMFARLSLMAVDCGEVVAELVAVQIWLQQRR